MAPKDFNNPRSCSETPKDIKSMVDVQRLSDGIGVKPQAYGGRKILALFIGMINSLCTFRKKVPWK
jgi:hypothetical protein